MSFASEAPAAPSVIHYGNLPFDLQPISSAALADLNRRLFEEEYLRSAFARDILAANERSHEERLAACRMIATTELPTSTVLGILVGSSTI